MKGQKTRISKLYVILWEITVPFVVISIVFFSLLIENKFYSWIVLINGTSKINFYVYSIYVFFVYPFFA